MGLLVNTVLEPAADAAAKEWERHIIFYLSS